MFDRLCRYPEIIVAWPRGTAGLLDSGGKDTKRCSGVARYFQDRPALHLAQVSGSYRPLCRIGTSFDTKTELPQGDH